MLLTLNKIIQKIKTDIKKSSFLKLLLVKIKIKFKIIIIGKISLTWFDNKKLHVKVIKQKKNKKGNLIILML